MVNLYSVRALAWDLLSLRTARNTKRGGGRSAKELQKEKKLKKEGVALRGAAFLIFIHQFKKENRVREARALSENKPSA